MRRSCVLVALALAVAGCSSGPPTVGARFQGPTAVAPFMGFTTKRTTSDGTPSPYLAVASMRGDELRILDVADDLPVLGPGVVFPLSVTTAPAPLLLASAALGDGGADLLIAASAGSPELQLVRTWTPDLTVVGSIPLGLEPDATILCLRAMTVPVADGEAKRARVLVGASGAASNSLSTPRLVVVDFTRDATGAIAAQLVGQRSLVFDPVDIAIEPGPVDLTAQPGGPRLFVATPDPVTEIGGAPVFGVARIDPAKSDPPQSWTVTALDAKAPTVALAAGRVSERSLEQLDPDGPEHYDLAPVLRVYAALDPRGCGPDQVIDCGIVTLRSTPGGAGTDGGDLEADPTRSDLEPLRQMPYRAPMQVPGVPISIAIGMPVASGTAQFNTDDFNPSGLPFALQKIAPGSGQRSTTAVAAVTASDGRVYLLDLARWAPMNDLAILRGSTRVAVTSSLSFLPSISDSTDPDFDKTAQLGLWNDFPLNAKSADTATAVAGGGDATPYVQVTPGYTDGDSWVLTWQGVLPRLGSREGVLVAEGSALFAAIQTEGGASPDVGSPDHWSVGARVGAPELGVLPGDIVEFTDYPSCGSDVSGRQVRSEATVTAVLTPSQSLVRGGVVLPGGALALAPLPCPGALPLPTAGASGPIRLTVRASKLVLTAPKLGHVGRPIVTLSADETAVFRFQWQVESTVSGVDLVTARKARRHFYPSDPACVVYDAAGNPSGIEANCVDRNSTITPQPPFYPGLPWLRDPLDPGPVVAFKVGLVDSSAAPGEGNLPRGATLQFITQSGISPTFRQPITGGTAPGNVLPYDKTGIVGHENDPVRFYVPFQDDQVIDFSTAESSASVRTIR